VTWSRREVLGTLGLASAHGLWLAAGCGPHAAPLTPKPASAGEIRAWLHDAVERLTGAGMQDARALAVVRDRAVAGIDVLGAGVTRTHAAGAILTGLRRDGIRIERVTSELTADGIAAAARALAGDARPTAIAGSSHQQLTAIARDPAELTNADLLAEAAEIEALEPARSSRIVYAAAAVEVDDANVWAVASGFDRAQRLVRYRRSAVRVAWSGTRPVIGEVHRAWRGELVDQKLTADELASATHAALGLVTPTAFDGGVYPILLEPSVAAIIVDAAARGLLTAQASVRPEVKRRLAVGARVAAPLISVTDDPTVAGAYGGYGFDDEGELAAPLVLVDHGHVVGVLADRAAVASGHAATAGRGRRRDHLGPVVAGPSHVRIATGVGDRATMLDDGFVLEGGVAASIDPSSDRLIVAVARGRERRAGRDTGRVFADLELVGSLSDLLSSITGVSQQHELIGRRDDGDAPLPWRSMDAPWLAGRGELRARRRLG